MWPGRVGRSTVGRRRPLVWFVAAAVMGALVVAAPVAAEASRTFDCDSHPLQPKIDNASAGSTLLISGTCHGNFVVKKDLTLKGDPSATLDGGGGGSTLSVTGTHAIHLRSLVVTGGQAAKGGGIFMPSGGLLALDAVTVRDNVAAADGFANGGGIFAPSTILAIRHSFLLRNHAEASGGGVEVAQGGGLYIVGGSVNVSDSVLRGNQATADASASVGEADGGGIFSIDVSLTISSSRFRANRATVTAPDSAEAQAGAVLFQTDSGGQLAITQSTFVSNSVGATSNSTHTATALAGALKISLGDSPPGTASVSDSLLQDSAVTASSSQGRADAEGGAILSSEGTLTMTSSQVLGSMLTAGGDTKATSEGGGLEVLGSLTVRRSTVSGSVVTAHSNNDAAVAGGGGIDALATGSTNVQFSTIDGNSATSQSDSSGAGAGGGGIQTRLGNALVLRASTVSGNEARAIATLASAEALGGGLDLESPAANDRIVNSTIIGNQASVDGPNSDSAGGAIEIVDAGLVVHLGTIARNVVAATGSNVFAGGGGLDVEQGTTRLEGTILAANTGVTGPNCIGTHTSDGFNLYGTTTGCTFTPVGTDQTNTGPKLGSLADNGGPTKTMALRAGSPALNRIPTTPCHGMAGRDQRGVARPQGPACDVGAFERKV
jgi:hypothetical protein